MPADPVPDGDPLIQIILLLVLILVNAFFCRVGNRSDHVK